MRVHALSFIHSFTHLSDFLRAKFKQGLHLPLLSERFVYRSTFTLCYVLFCKRLEINFKKEYFEISLVLDRQ